MLKVMLTSHRIFPLLITYLTAVCLINHPPPCYCMSPGPHSIASYDGARDATGTEWNDVPKKLRSVIRIQVAHPRHKKLREHWLAKPLLAGRDPELYDSGLDLIEVNGKKVLSKPVSVGRHVSEEYDQQYSTQAKHSNSLMKRSRATSNDRFANMPLSSSGRRKRPKDRARSSDEFNSADSDFFNNLFQWKESNGRTHANIFVEPFSMSHTNSVPAENRFGGQARASNRFESPEPAGNRFSGHTATYPVHPRAIVVESNEIFDGSNINIEQPMKNDDLTRSKTSENNLPPGWRSLNEIPLDRWAYQPVNNRETDNNNDWQLPSNDIDNSLLKKPTSSGAANNRDNIEYTTMNSLSGNQEHSAPSLVQSLPINLHDYADCSSFSGR